MQQRFAIFLLLFFIAQNSFAIPSVKKDKSTPLPTLLEADEIDGDGITNVITATGNVEVKKGSSIIYADKIIYNKDGKTIRAVGHVKAKDIEIGNMRASEAEVKDDFSSGTFLDSKMVFIDGSYLSSPKIDRETPLITVLKSPVYSLCPNDDIAADNELAGKQRDFASIKSSKTTIDREKSVMRSRNGILRFYNVPVFYTPFISTPLPSKKRESGFLPPVYTKTTNFGVGFKIPYYWNISPSMDLTTTPHLNISSDQIILGNEFRHMSKYSANRKYSGSDAAEPYRLSLELANNKIKSGNDRTVQNRTNREYRWDIAGIGNFDFTNDIGADFAINTISDHNYLRDYRFDYAAFTMSNAKLDYVKGRNYYGIKTVRFQELENVAREKEAQFILPSLDSHIESKPFLYKEKFMLTSNVTSIFRDSGLQYRRATIIPEVKIPFNLKGNLFDIDAKFQGDFYWLENNFKNGAPTNNYNSTLTNYKPEISFNWKLPLIQKAKNHTWMVEPMASFVSSSYKKSFTGLPNEDSNNSELTVSNLFVADRIAGYDRNESGERVAYGVKSSFFNKYGEFGLFVGQGYKRSDEAQDVVIRGFGSNKKSNIVGQAMYKATKYFSIVYSFQLNESNYRNDINQITTSLTFDRFSISSDYLFLRRSQQNLQEREQLSLSSNIKLTDRWKTTLSLSRDMITGRNLSRGVTFYRDGCCTTFGFSAVETNPTNLVKPQKTFNLSLSFKNI